MSQPTQHMLVRDLQGKPLFILDSFEDEKARDENATIVAARATEPEEDRLAKIGAYWMGSKVLMDISPADVAYPAARADFGIPDGDEAPFIADKVSAIHTVTHDRGYWWAENALDALQLVEGESSATGNVPELSPSFTKTSFTTTAYALGMRIPKLTTGNADFDLKKLVLRRLVDALRRAREYRVAALLQTPAQWATNNQVNIGATAKWNGGTTANPLTDMFNGLRVSALPANAIVLPEYAAQFFFQNANSQAMRDYVQSGGEMPKVIFARTKMSVSGNPAYVWAQSLTGINVPMVRLASDPVTDIPTTKTMRWVGPSTDGSVQDGILVRKFSRDQFDYIVVAHNDAEVILNNQVGALLVGATQ